MIELSIVYIKLINERSSIMSFDGVFTRAIVDELNQALTGGRINKIDQPFENEAILTIRNHRTNYSLLLSAHPQYARIHLTHLSYQNPMQPPQFVMVLRKYLNRAVLESIEQYENDRIVHFHFQNRDELGDEKELILICELMGRHSNIILIDQAEGKILESLRHVPPAVNSYRTLLPGADFKPAPAQDKLNPFDVEANSLVEALKNSQKDALGNQVMDVCQGIGRDTAKEIALRSGQMVIQVPEIMEQLEKELKDSKSPASQYFDQTKSYFTPVPFQIYEDLESKSYSSLSELLDAFYSNKASKDRAHQMSREIDTLVKNEIKKNDKKLQKQKEEYEETQTADDWRIKGEVLTAYMHQVQSGMEEITLPNFYDEEKDILIELNPQKTPAENAQYLFANYQKLKSRRSHLSQLILSTQQEVDYWESVQTQLDLAQPEDIEDIREELIAEGYIKQKKNKKKNKRTQKAKAHAYLTSDGIPILVGRNNRQNDELTMKIANKTHYWFHTKDIPGSHVILQTDQPSGKDIQEAAEIAAYHSKAQSSSNVPVDYVQVKHVRKPRGAKPGFVIYDNQKTSFVTPNIRVIDQRKMKDN